MEIVVAFLKIIARIGHERLLKLEMLPTNPSEERPVPDIQTNLHNSQQNASSELDGGNPSDCVSIHAGRPLRPTALYDLKWTDHESGVAVSGLWESP